MPTLRYGYYFKFWILVVTGFLSMPSQSPGTTIRILTEDSTTGLPLSGVRYTYIFNPGSAAPDTVQGWTDGMGTGEVEWQTVSSVPAVSASQSVSRGYPNPSTGTVHFDLSSAGMKSLHLVRVEVYDVRGRRLASGSVDGGVLILPGGLPFGTYFAAIIPGPSEGRTIRRITGRPRAIAIDFDSPAGEISGAGSFPAIVDSARVEFTMAGYEPCLWGRVPIPEGTVDHLARLVPLPQLHPDTLRILIRDLAFPNVTAADSGWVLADAAYDTIIEGASGRFLRYGGVSAASPDAINFNPNGTYTSRASEDDRTPPPSHMFIWFDTSALPPDCRVLDAGICLNVMRYSINNLASGYVACRLDTLTSDYALVASESPNSDPAWLNTTWNHVDAGAGIPWTPALAARDDWHDFGPRGAVNEVGGILGDGSVDASNWGIRLDAADPIQQVVDNGNQGRGMLFVVYSAGNPTLITSWSCGNTAPRIARGNPCLTITAVRERGSKPWNGVRVPIVMSIDDGDSSHARFHHIMSEAGHGYSEVVMGDFWRGGTPAITKAQLDSINEDPRMDIVLHTLYHSALGELDTDHQIDFELARGWVDTLFTHPRDTLTLKDFAWPAASDGNIHEALSLQGISRLVANGYRSARGTRVTTWNNAVGPYTPLGWYAHVNMFALGTISSAAVFGSWGGELTGTALEDSLKDIIDSSYTDYGQAPVILYWHDSNDVPDDGWPNTGVRPDQLRDLVEIVDRTSYLDFMTIGQVVDLRLDGAEFLYPDPSFAPSMYDSMIVVAGDLNFLQVWVAPKED